MHIYIYMYMYRIPGLHSPVSSRKFPDMFCSETPLRREQLSCGFSWTPGRETRQRITCAVVVVVVVEVVIQGLHGLCARMTHLES